MAKLRLMVWTVMVGAAAVILLRDVHVPVSEDSAAAAMGVVQLVAGALAAYLFVVTLLAVRLPRLAPTFVRRLVAAAVGGGLLLTPMVASAETAVPPPTDVPVLHRLPDPAPASGDVSTPEVGPSRHQNGAVSAAEVVVRPGDHLWGIAARTLAARLGRSPSDAEVVPYWQALIEANRDRLVSRDDPDLIVPGQVFHLPS